jgi:predicted alpha-1,2-mannosidase
MAGRELKVCFNFKTEEQERIKIKFALSSVSIEGALLNLASEVPDFDFEKTKRTAEQKWENELSKVQIEADENIKTNFYTAMYHTFIAPNEFMDVDGWYQGLDHNLHQASNFTNYTTFSLWDTYRALHPLYNLIQTKRNDHMVQSMLAHYDQSALHMLPIWSHYANDNWCMSGYHSVSVITDAILKGTSMVNAKLALDACVKTAKQLNYEGIGEYIKKGYVPSERSNVSVSNTLEYAYDDWCIAQLAKKVGDEPTYQEFIKRSSNYRNVFDTTIHFVRAKQNNGQFVKAFDALSTNNQGLIEGNSWNYSFFVPHNPQDLVRLMGGKKNFSKRLDTLFSMYLPDRYFAETEDITREGIIGTYVHGNEPAHHVAYLYNYSDRPYRTQEMLRVIMANQYKPQVDGLGGNDDCGQMSAWYIFSALGFYPLAPGATSYEVGSPIVNSAILHFENGKQLHIVVQNQSAKNMYVKAIYHNGKLLSGLQLEHTLLMQGGELKFVMSDKR